MNHLSEVAGFRIPVVPNLGISPALGTAFEVQYEPGSQSRGVCYLFDQADAGPRGSAIKPEDFQPFVVQLLPLARVKPCAHTRSGGVNLLAWAPPLETIRYLRPSLLACILGQELLGYSPEVAERNGPRNEGESMIVYIRLHLLGDPRHVCFDNGIKVTPASSRICFPREMRMSGQTL